MGGILWEGLTSFGFVLLFFRGSLYRVKMSKIAMQAGLRGVDEGPVRIGIGDVFIFYV